MALTEKKFEALLNTLGINDSSATDAEIRQAFRAAALKHHPDKNQNNPAATEKFKEINEAYETLKNENFKFSSENLTQSSTTTNQQQNEKQAQNQRFNAERSEILNQQNEKLLADILAFEKVMRDKTAALNAEFKANNSVQHISFKKIDETQAADDDALKIADKPLSADTGALVPFKDGQVATTPAFAKGSVYQFDYTNANGVQNSVYLDNTGNTQTIYCKDPASANTPEGIEAKVMAAKAAGWSSIAIYDDYKNIDMIKKACEDNGLGIEIRPRPTPQAAIEDKKDSAQQIENKAGSTAQIENQAQHIKDNPSIAPQPHKEEFPPSAHGRYPLDSHGERHEQDEPKTTVRPGKNN